jgi:hypothetical protein
MLRAALKEFQLLVQLIKYGWYLKLLETMHLPIHTLSLLLRYRFETFMSHIGESVLKE